MQIYSQPEEFKRGPIMKGKTWGNWCLKEEILSNVDCVFFPRWVAIFDQIIAVPIQLAAVIFGDKIAGAWGWVSSKDGASENEITQATTKKSIQALKYCRCSKGMNKYRCRFSGLSICLNTVKSCITLVAYC